MKRRSKTREEWIASLRWNIKDAREALRNAVSMSDWRGVRKYAGQLETLEKKLYDAEARVGGARRRTRQGALSWHERIRSEAHRPGLRDQKRAKTKQRYAIRKVGHGWQVYSLDSPWVSRQVWAYRHLAEKELHSERP